MLLVMHRLDSLTLDPFMFVFRISNSLERVTWGHPGSLATCRRVQFTQAPDLVRDIPFHRKQAIIIIQVWFGYGWMAWQPWQLVWKRAASDPTQNSKSTPPARPTISIHIDGVGVYLIYSVPEFQTKPVCKQALLSGFYWDVEWDTYCMYCTVHVLLQCSGIFCWWLVTDW